MNWSERLILSDGLDAIRDSRIASQGWLSGPFLVTFDIRGSDPVRFREDCERGANGTIYRKPRRRRNCRSRNERCKNGNKAELRHAALREPPSKKPFVASASRGICCRKLVAIRESRIATHPLHHLKTTQLLMMDEVWPEK